MEECRDAELFMGAIPLCRPSQERNVRTVVPVGVELITLPIRSANAWLSFYERHWEHSLDALTELLQTPDDEETQR